MIPLFKVFMSQEIDFSLLELLHSGYIGQGKVVDEFEGNLKKFFKSDYVATVNSGTSGLHLALHMAKEDNAEVLTSPMTCTATNWPILANGLKIKWVDVDPNTFNMDLDDLERKITKDTKIIMIVHWGGTPIDYDRLNRILNRANREFGFAPIVIEDCAHALTAKWGNMPITFGSDSIQVFSLQAIKHVTAVDGGVIVLPNEEMYRRAKLLRWYGIDRETNKKDMRCESNIAEWGFKFHMNDVNALIGMKNLEHVNSISEHIDKVASIYDKRIAHSIDGVIAQFVPAKASSAYWLYSLRVRDRERFAEHMDARGIMVSKVHERNDKHSCVRKYGSLLPGLEKLSKEMISIPIGGWVSEEDANYICDCIEEFYGVERENKEKA